MIESRPYVFIEGISSHYSDWYPKLRSRADQIQTIVEVGTFNGGGTKFLERKFKKAHITTYERPDHFEPKHINLAKIRQSFSRRTQSFIELSPPIEFEGSVDLCFFDIGHNLQNIRDNFHFWFDKLTGAGMIIMLIPWSTPQKKEVRSLFLQELEEEGLIYETVVNWVILKKKNC